MFTFTTFSINVELNGEKPFTLITGFNLFQRYDQHHQFEIRVPLDSIEGEGAEKLSKSKNYIGQPIKIEIHAEALESSSPKQSEFNGVVTSISVSRHGGTGGDLVVSGFSSTIILEQGKNTKAYTETVLSDLVQNVTAKYPRNGINFNISASPNPSLPFTLQYKESAYNFIARLANRYGQWFFFDGKDCVFGGLPSSTPIDMHFGMDLISFDLGIKLGASKFTTAAYDATNGQPLSGTSEVTGLDDYASFAYNESNKYFYESETYNTDIIVSSSTQLNDIAKARRGGIVAGLVTMTGVSTNPQLKIGASISVKGESADYGTYTVIALSLTLDEQGTYRNQFEAIPASIVIPPPSVNVYEPVVENQPAKVTDNNDNENMGRVKVAFMWDEQTKTDWARVVTPNAGQSYGSHFLPEVGDEVLVAFEQNNPDRPLILGGLYNGKANQSDRADEKNNIKTIRTKSGNEIKFTDTDGAQEILITNPGTKNQITLSMKDNGKITIQSEGDIDIKGQKINIEATQDFTLKGANVTLTANEKVAATANTAMELKANQNISLASQMGDVTGSGLNISLTGNVGATLKGNATVEVSASGMATIKGGMVMIN